FASEKVTLHRGPGASGEDSRNQRDGYACHEHEGNSGTRLGNAQSIHGSSPPHSRGNPDFRCLGAYLPERDGGSVDLGARVESASGIPDRIEDFAAEHADTYGLMVSVPKGAGESTEPIKMGGAKIGGVVGSGSST